MANKRYDILLQKSEAKKAQAEARKNKNVTLTGEVKETKRVRPKTKGTATGRAFLGETAKKLIDAAAKVSTELIRKEMKLEVHVLVVNTAQFSSLIRDHISLVKRAARKAEDPEVKALLEGSLGSSGNLYKLSKNLKMEFQRILERELNKKSGILKWKKQEQGGVAIYYIQRKKQATRAQVLAPKSKTSQTNFNAIQDVMTEVKKELVNNSRAGTTKRITGIIIGGLDIDYDEINTRGIGDTAKSKLSDRAPIHPNTGNVRAGTGIQLGHFRGPATKGARRLFNIVQDAMKNLVRPKELLAEAKGFKDAIHKFDAEIRFNDIIYNIAQTELKGEVDISIIGLEQAAKNSLTGDLAGASAKEFRSWIIKNAQAIVTVDGSKPLVNMILDDTMNTLVGVPPKRKTINRKAKVTKTVKSKTKAVESKIATTKNSSDLDALVTKKGGSYNIQELLILLNANLEDQIRKNMGKGGAKNKLNWRTGRFGQSAKVTNLIATGSQREMLATVKYYGYPYSRFADKGDPLYKPLRDPKGIFGRSIRQILAEEKIANLRRVKVELRG